MLPIPGAILIKPINNESHKNSSPKIKQNCDNNKARTFKSVKEEVINSNKYVQGMG